MSAGQESKNPQQDGHKNIVREIFDKSLSGTGKISPIFTHFKHSPKRSATTQKNLSLYSSRVLPVAIDIGTSGVKLVQMSNADRQRLEIVCIDQENYPLTATRSAADLEIALTKLLKRNRLGPSCAITLSSKDVIVYDLTLPPMPKSELSAAISYRLSQIRPFGLDIDKIIYNYMKWAEISSLPKTSQQKIWVGCAPADVIREHIFMLEKAGLKVVNIGIPSFSLINLSSAYKPTELKDTITLWIDLGAEESVLAIETEDAMCFSRNITLTSKYMTEVIAQHCGITEKEAEEIKIAHGLSYWAPDKKMPALFESTKVPGKEEDPSKRVYYSLVTLLENLVVDVEHSFKTFSYQATQSQITKFDRVILSGGGASLKNLDMFLSYKLSVPVERINPFNKFKVADAVKAQRPYLINLAPTFGVCTGLAAGQKTAAYKQLNLLPEKDKPLLASVIEGVKESPLILIVFALVIGVMLFGLQSIRAVYYKAKLGTLVREVKATKNRLAKDQGLQLEFAKEETTISNNNELLKARLELIKGAVRSPDKLSVVLESISSLLPEEIWITKLAYQEGKMTISGSTADMALITNLIRELKASEKFIDADLTYTQKNATTGIYDLEITAEVKE